MYVPVHQPKHDDRGRRGTYVSARTIRVRLAFSMENFTLPPSPAIRPILSAYTGCSRMYIPIARARWSPWRVLTSLISKESR